MASVLFILFFITIIVFYGYSSISLKREYIQSVEAGGLHEATQEEQKQLSYYAPHRMTKDSKGRIIDEKNTMKIIVKGKCMEPLKINSGDILFVKKFGKNEDLSNELHQGDVLLIYLSDKKIYKIRAFDSYEDSEKSILKTYRYDNNGNRQDSSKPHNRKDIIGRVEYNLSSR